MSSGSEGEKTESERTELPIEKGFPIERVNEIAEKEGRAKMYYRPIYTMHKWWARRLGCVFRAISLYALLDDPEKVEVHEPGSDNESLADFTDEGTDIQSLIERVDLADPESLWDLYPKDVRIEDKKVLDPFMGGGTSLVEASRFGADVVGNDLNPVAWFVTKKELEAGQTDVEELEAAFEQVKEEVADEITQYYKTPCPNGDHEADVMYYFWVKELDCVSCGETVPLFKDYRIASGRYENDEEYNVICPDCDSVVLVDDWHEEGSCGECGNVFNPEKGNVSRGGKYNCPDCGQKYGIKDAIQEQDGYDERLYAVEYYCGECDSKGSTSSSAKSYKAVDDVDVELFESAWKEWEESDELHEYVPSEEIRPGWYTASTQFEGSAPGAHDVLQYGYESWTDMFNKRQLLCLAKLLRAIDKVEDENLREFLLLTFSESLNYNSMMIGYNPSYNKATNIFKTNSFDPPVTPLENNVWGGKYGTGTFTAMWDMVKRGVEYARSPTERYVKDGETHETASFGQSIGESKRVLQQDARTLDFENEFDAILTDPPYYDNIIYSELSDYFYVWQKILLEKSYDGFDNAATPRAESIVSNPAEEKGVETFETEIQESFAAIHDSLKSDGVLAFTYHHNDAESWGELLEALCDVGFEVTATYPVSADIEKFIQGEAVSFDIVVVARPVTERKSTSWNSLRREIYRTARKTRKKLEANRDLSRGDIGVIEMGRCFHEYSKHHGKVQREGEIMSAKEVVDEIYGIIQEASEIGVIDVFLDLLNSSDPSFDDVSKLCRGTNAKPEELKEMALYNQDDGFELGTWDNEKRRAYIEERVNGDGDEHLTDLDKLQFLRYRYEMGKSVQNYVEKWGVNDDLRELAGRMADATGDNVYERVLGDRDITSFGE